MLALRDGFEPRQQGAVAKVDAIEVADGQSRGLRGRTRITAENEHQERGVAEGTKREELYRRFKALVRMDELECPGAAKLFIEKIPG